MGLVSKAVWWFLVSILVLISVIFYSLELSLFSIILIVILAVLISPIFERIFKIRTWIKVIIIVFVVLYILNYSGLFVPADEIIQNVDEPSTPKLEEDSISNSSLKTQTNKTNNSMQPS